MSGRLLDSIVTPGADISVVNGLRVWDSRLSAYKTLNTIPIFETNGGSAFSAQSAENTIATLSVPSIPYATVCLASFSQFANNTVAGDNINVRFKINGTTSVAVGNAGRTTGMYQFSNIIFALAANTAATLTLTIVRVSGTGTYTTFADATTNRFNVVCIPS